MTVTQSRVTSSNMADTSDYPRGESFMDPFRGILVAYFMPENCYDKFFLDFDFLDGEWSVSSFPAVSPRCLVKMVAIRCEVFRDLLQKI